MEFDPDKELAELQEYDQTELLSDLSEEAGELAFLLHVQAAADTESHHLTILGEGHNVILPPTVLEHLDDSSRFEYLSIDFERSASNRAASLAIKLFFSTIDDEDMIVCLEHSTTSEQSDVYAAELLIGSDMFRDDSEPPLMLPDAVPSSEISRLLMGLCVPSKTNDYSDYDILDHNDPSLLATFNEALEKQAADKISYGRFDLSPYGHDGYLSYLSEDDTLVHVELGSETDGGTVRAAIPTTLSTDKHRADESALRFYLNDAKGHSVPLVFSSLKEERDQLQILKDQLKSLIGSLARPPELLEDMDQRASRDEE